LKRLRILVDGHVLDGKHQGTSSYIAGLYSALAKKNQCDIYVATEKQSSIHKYFGDTANINWVPLSSTGKFQRLSTEFDRIVKRINPDYSHFQYITPLIKRGKWINTIHDILFLDFPEEFPLSYRIKNHVLFRFSALRSDILTTVSDYSKERLIHHFNLSKDKVIVTPNAVDDICNVKESPIDSLVGQSFFVYVSRLEPRKNQHLLIDAFLQAKLPLNTKLILVGAPAIQYPALNGRLTDNAISNRIIHLQGIAQSELVWLYKNAKAAIYPSKCEGFGIPPLEASVLGTKSFCAKNTALAELEPYVDGVFNAENIEEMIQIFENDLTTCDETIKMKVKEMYRWDKSADILFEALQSSL
jgi:glycosyltransferase involved in cell wall biosynthesis